ncbi:hypothetical protein AB1Y20_014707 [Prymnesium parvum]|uniref:DUF1995 domain-containing protein n=1 Tax=Prymnesium parvum TaxID=97485 RepID=A0AB34ID19_PRYPA
MALLLTSPPPGLSEYSPLSARAGALSSIRRASAAAIGRALSDEKELLELEFPPLLERKTQFDDYSNVEILDANRDFAVLLANEPELRCGGEPGALWLCFADDGEAELAREAWPGRRYAEVTVTSIAAAVGAVGGDALRPFGAWVRRGEAEAAAAKAKLAPAPALQLVVQPGDGGPMEDWLNVELLYREGTPIVCLNGALDKVTSGYYSNFLNPKLAQCASRFYSRFEQAYFCKPIGSGRGWLFRVYPEPWQLYRQTREELVIVDTYEERPTLAACSERLRLP